jgi:transcriptional regulator with XRE-family HTH domain
MNLEMYTLKTARNKNGFSQLEASKLIGISKYTLSNYECGKSFPDVPILKKIEKVYGVTYEQLIFLNNNNAKSVKANG